MAALKVLQFDMTARIEELDEQLNACSVVQGRLRESIRNFLLQEGIYSIEDITDEDMKDYRLHLNQFPEMGEKQKQYYVSNIEVLQFSYYAPLHEDFIRSIEADMTRTNPLKRAEIYLMAHGISSADAIDYDVRAAYQKYLMEVVHCAKVGEYVKALDRIKINAIRHENEEAPFKQRKLSYTNGRTFLLYHPDYKVAMSFNWVRDKEELVFDFSLNAKEQVKHQIFFMLNYILENMDASEKVSVRHDRRERFLIPLKLLYMFCIDQGIEDIEKMQDDDIELFKERLRNVGNTLDDSYIQLLDNIRKFLFLRAKKTNWEATIWYLERFHFQRERMNPSRPVIRLSFTMIKNEENRRYLQSYMKYMLGVTDLAIGNIRFRLYHIAEFLKHCDDKELGVPFVMAQDIEAYSTIIEDGVKSETYNLKMANVYSFFRFLVVKGFIKDIPFILEYYLKDTVPAHHDRAVPKETVHMMLSNLKYFPDDLRLMYLHLWSLGLRINEVCTIQANAYFERNGETWIRLYQNKMKAEKIVPIPAMVYQLMKEYIRVNDRKTDDYVFQNEKGGAYKAGTFTKKMKEKCIELGISCGDYVFRSHDYRHTVATNLSRNGASIMAIRDFMGHKSEEMTKQYIDYVPERIDSANDEYFNNEENNLASKIQVKKGGTHGK